ncbi:MAG: phosphoenolpyruvate--protein phosphotransferase [Planctomycetota bacterium]
MQIKKGIAVSPGIVIARALLLDATEYPIPMRQITPESAGAETAKLEKAFADSISELETIISHLRKRIAKEAIPIIEAHIKIIRDHYLKSQMLDHIKKDAYTAEYAVSRTLRKYIKALTSNQTDSFWGSRVNDIYDIEKRIIRNLVQDKIAGISKLKEPVIIVSQDLTPTETASLDKNKIKGVTTDKGGRTSHTAIIARALGIPAVVALNNITLDIASGDLLIVDGNSGIVVIDPDKETIKKYSALGKNFDFYERKLLSEIRNLPTKTKDGREIMLCANIELPEETSTVIQYGADGVGLFRTEWLYSDSYILPSEKEHFEIYKRVASALKGRKLTIRTLDIGGDKLAATDGEAPIEKNPFLGCRAIRLSLQNTGVFELQLRGILRASHYGNVNVMFPMIATIDEIRQAKNILERVKNGLRKKRVPFNEDVKIGIMIEIPSSAIMADALIKEVDFCSIGTNDLIQYTMAVDRTNEKVAYLYQPSHPSVLRLIKYVIDQGKKHNKPVSMCGEMAGDWIYTPLLLGMGLKEFSVSPIVIPEIKKIIRSITLDEARKISENVFTMESAVEIDKYLRDCVKNIAPQLS